MKKADIYLITAVIIMAAVLFFIFNLLNNKKAESVIVKVDNEIYGSYSLNQNAEYEIKTDYGYNHLIVVNGFCYIDNSDCPNKICINTGKICDDGQVITCLPHKLIVYVE